VKLTQILLLCQAFKAVFTSPSSAKEADGDGEGADIIENNRRARRALYQVKVKTCVASIINMRKVTARSIAYVVCQVSKYSPSKAVYNILLGRFVSHYRACRLGAPSMAILIMKLSGIISSTSLRPSLAPSRDRGWTNCLNGGLGMCCGLLLLYLRYLTLLSRKIFGKNHREDLTPEVVSRMSVTALAEQRRVLEDAAFDSE
jgi:hypothetical protein